VILNTIFCDQFILLVNCSLGGCQNVIFRRCDLWFRERLLNVAVFSGRIPSIHLSSLSISSTFESIFVILISPADLAITNLFALLWCIKANFFFFETTSRLQSGLIIDTITYSVFVDFCWRWHILRVFSLAIITSFSIRKNLSFV
jgi:hypothetical protein